VDKQGVLQIFPTGLFLLGLAEIFMRNQNGGGRKLVDNAKIRIARWAV
jgi:hypothetical protein